MPRIDWRFKGRARRKFAHLLPKEEVKKTEEVEEVKKTEEVKEVTKKPKRRVRRKKDEE